MAKKKSAKKTTAKATAKTSKTAAKKTTAKTAAKGKAKTRAPRKAYALGLKKKVVAAIRKGMTHKEAAKAFEVGIHSIPNWIKLHK